MSGPLPDLKLRAQVQLPARIDDGVAIRWTRASGNYRADLDWSLINELDSVPPEEASDTKLPVWNRTTKQFTMVPFTPSNFVINGTSSTSNSVGLGSKSFTTQADISWVVGTRLRASDADNPATNFMEGVTTSYSGNALTVDMDLAVGSGTISNWNIAIAAQQADAYTFNVADRTALKALDTGTFTSAYLEEGNRAGVFNWIAGDFSSEVSADTTEALYVKADAVSSSSGAWVRGSLGEINVLWGGADLTGTADSAAVINALKTLGPLYAPAGSYKLTAKIGLVTGFKLRGDGIDQTIFITSGVDSFGPAVGSTDYTNIELRDFTVKQASGWGTNTCTAIDFSNVSYSRVERVKAMYHQYGVFMRRTASARQCYFNTFSEVWVFGSQYYFSLQDTGDTPNKITFIDCRTEDNGQRTSGYGMDLCGWGHTVVGFYAGLPGHTAALRLQSGCGGLIASGIYGESSTLTQVVLDATTGNPNTVIGVHADGTSLGVTKSSSSCRTLYINAGTATNIFHEQKTTASLTPSSVSSGSYDYQSISVTGIAVGDTAKVIPPTGWPVGLVRGEPIVESGNVKLPYVNNSGSSQTPPSGTYTVVWQDRT